MQEYRTTAAGHTGSAVVVDLDDEIVEVILAGQPVAGVVARQPDGLVVMAISGVFAPGVLGTNRPDRQKRLRPPVAVARVANR